MTTFLPTTLVDVIRPGTTEDAWGDETGTGGTTVSAAVPAAIAENRQRSYLASEQRGGVVEYFTVRLRPTADVVEGDQLRDTRTGALYQVDAVSNPPAVVGVRTDVRATCRKTGATSTR